MNYKVGDLVTRKSYNNDIVFQIIEIKNNTSYLKGIYIRLLADSSLDDLEPYKGRDLEEEEFERSLIPKNMDRSDYFYLPGKILHIDSDPDYLKKCLNYYEKMNIWSKGIIMNESEIPKSISNLIREYNPNIVVITGHDAYYKKNNSYKNSIHFINAIKEARKLEKSHDNLIIIAGACQSNYEELIKAGANFASSPKRINIHALDPAIIASNMSLANSNTEIDLKSILESTRYGCNGIGGIKTKGTMYIGYPR